MFLLPTRLSSAIAPHFDLANRFANNKVSTVENVKIRVQHFCGALWHLRPTVVGGSPDGIRKFFQNKHRALEEHLAWVWSPQDMAANTYCKERNALLVKVAFVAVAILLIVTAGPRAIGAIRG